MNFVKSLIILYQSSPHQVAREYYESSDKYLFEEFQTERLPGTRSVAVGSLYDVFCNIRDDEAEHVATMHAMQRQDVLERSPNVEAVMFTTFFVLLGLRSETLGGGN